MIHPQGSPCWVAMVGALMQRALCFLLPNLTQGSVQMLSDRNFHLSKAIMSNEWVLPALA